MGTNRKNAKRNTLQAHPNEPGSDAHLQYSQSMHRAECSPTIGSHQIPPSNGGLPANHEGAAVHLAGGTNHQTSVTIHSTSHPSDTRIRYSRDYKVSHQHLWSLHEDASLAAQSAFMEIASKAMSDPSTFPRLWPELQRLHVEAAHQHAELVSMTREMQAYQQIDDGQDEPPRETGKRRKPRRKKKAEVAPLDHLYQGHGARSPDRVHPLLEQYYDKAGDVTVWRERVLDLDAEHNREVNERDQILVNRATVVSDFEFGEAHLRERDKLMRELASIEAEAGKLYYMCIENGLKPDGPQPGDVTGQHPIPAAQISPTAPTLHRTSQHARPLLYEGLYNGVSTAGRILTEVLNPSDRIHSWFKGLFHSGTMATFPRNQATVVGIDPNQPFQEDTTRHLELFSNSDVVYVGHLSHKTHGRDSLRSDAANDLTDYDVVPRKKSWIGEAPMRRYSEGSMPWQQRDEQHRLDQVRLTTSLTGLVNTPD